MNSLESGYDYLFKYIVIGDSGGLFRFGRSMAVVEQRRSD